MTVSAGPNLKSHSVFYPTTQVNRLRKNITQEAWAKQLAEKLTDAARPWLEMSDDTLWSLMFGATLPRAWMVWSDGHCPACKTSVTMYDWKIKALERPWKVQCPHCREQFPKNDFYAFYCSGLDGTGIFDPNRADRSLLFNTEHPDPSDPLHKFGVDDGTGYVQDGKRWRFIGAYLVYGQWKQAVLGGILALAQAYIITGEPLYAHKAGILLDRTADLYPAFDFKAQATVYEIVLCDGYVSTWHDACEETRQMALAYDMIFEALKKDTELTAFLAAKAQRCGLVNSKTSFLDIQRNIETGILHDALANSHKIYSNYPRRDIAQLVIRAVLNQPRQQWYPFLDAMLVKATAVDGVTGEKGLAGYSSYTIQGLAGFLAQWERAEPGFLAYCFEAHPALRQTYRFHIDTWCMQQYYPQVGDTGTFAKKVTQYQGMRMLRPNRESKYSYEDNPLSPSMYPFLWQLYRLTNDPAYVQVIYQDNDETIDGLPYDLFAEDAPALRRKIADVMAQHGTIPQAASVNKEQWCLAILRSGQDDHVRASWLHYAVGGNHHHQDAMNLGLFAYGLDLMPEFGYPPVQFGGWSSPKALWYTMSAAHNTVVVDGQNHGICQGQTTLWAQGQSCQVVRVSAPGAIPLVSAIPKKHPLADSWQFMWDPDNRGQELGWHTDSFQDGGWFDIQTDTVWQYQPIGKQWKAEHGEDYHGVAWYRCRFEIQPHETNAKLKLLFGAVDQACTIWVNEQKILDRPYPYQGDTTSWDHCFSVDITDALRYDRPNTIAVCVDGGAIGEGGIKRGVWLATETSQTSSRFERTIVQVDMPDPEHFYLLDIFRVRGGQDHTLFMHSHFSAAQASGLSLLTGPDYGHNTQMRNFRWDRHPVPGWHVDWKIEDRYQYLPPEKEIHLRYTSLTTEAQAALAEGWISHDGYNSAAEAWIPRLLVRRQTTEPVLASNFVGVIEPYDKASSIERIRRLPLLGEDGRAFPDSAAAVEIIHKDGVRDLILAVDPETLAGSSSPNAPGILVQPDWQVKLAGELCLLRQNAEGKLVYLFAAHTANVHIQDRQFSPDNPDSQLEWKGD